jgi:hypothetical protein
MTRNIPRITRTTQPIAFCGRFVFLDFPPAGLYLAITAMVSPRNRAAMQESNLMSRKRIWPVLTLALGLAACGKKELQRAEVLPETVAVKWRRTAVRDLAAGGAPDAVPRKYIEAIRSASYEGPGRLEARAYRLISPDVALDVVQRWKPSMDTVFFYRGRFLVVVKWESANREALQEFVRELERRLGAAGN